MHILVTAGNTLTPIDQVRGITNIFTGRTGTGIALHAHRRGHRITLLTSRPDAVTALCPAEQRLHSNWSVHTYRTFDELANLMAEHIGTNPPAAVIHSAAVSDYRVAGVFARSPETKQLVDVSAGKVKSHHQELWLKLTPTPKLIDQIRTDWQFRGILVKFKLEVGVSEQELLTTAEQARQQSSADLLVANTLESAQDWAYLGPLNDSGQASYVRISRADLPARLLAAVEAYRKD